MWKAEEDFPRGGAPVGKSGHRKKENLEPGSKKAKRQNVGGKGTSQNKSDVKSTQKRTSQQGKRKRESDDFQVPPVKRLKKKTEINIDYPLREDLVPELCVLGCVRRIFDYGVSMSLPGNQTADLPITEISEGYTRQLKALANSESLDSTEAVSPLDEMFSPGMLLPVSIKNVEQVKNTGRNKIKLTALPSVINANLPLSDIQDGLLLCGYVSSVEDHGYRIDLGKKGVQAFLATLDAEHFIQKHHNGNVLKVGERLWCVLKMKGKPGPAEGKTRVFNVTINPEIVKKAMLAETSNMNMLLPGMTVKAKVEKKGFSGLQVSVYSFDGCIHGSQLPKSSLKYKVGVEIDAKVLYAHPVTKSLQLTALPAIVYNDGSAIKLFKDLRVGTITEGTVSRVERKKGLYFSLPNNVLAFSPVSQLDDESTEPDLTQFQEGQAHQCRVLNFNFMEGVAVVTLKKSVLEEKFLTVAELSPGDVVQASVKDVLPKGLLVKLSKGIHSFVPCMHLGDVPIKHPEKKFEPGAMLKFRVLRVDTSKSKVSLTHKKSLVRSKYPVLTEYSQLRPRMILEGYILAVKDNVVVVSFFNDVKGIVLKRDMSRENVTDPCTMFYVGQVIRCRVLKYNLEEQKLRLSFNFDTNEEKENVETEIDVKQYAVGEIIRNVRIVRKEDSRFRVCLGSPKDTAVLPFAHLSDFHEIQELQKVALRPGQTIKEVVVIHEQTKKMVTMKESFLQAAQSDQIVKEFSSLKCGLLQPAVIKNHEEYGIFLELTGGFTGLCPAKTLTGLQPTILQELFKAGQSVVTRLVKIDSDKQRFLGSLKVDDCYEGGLEAPVALLKNYLTQHDKVFTSLEKNGELSNYLDVHVRDIVKVTVSSVFKKGILGDLPSGAKALATKYHLAGVEPEVGCTYEAVVLFVDPLTPCVELSMDTKLVKAVKARKENKKTMLKAGQSLKADVLLVKPEFLLMATRAHGAGQFVYVPARKHMNDVERNPAFKVGTFSDVVIKETCEGKQLAVLRMNDPESQARDKEVASFKHLAKHNIQPGDIIDVKVKAVHALQMNIMAGGCHGRVHITQVTDDPKEGQNPIQKYHPEQIIKVRVIGLRDVKSQNYLPITRPKATRSLLECTLRESKMESGMKDLLSSRCDLSTGDKIWVYVLKVSAASKVWVQVSLNQQGCVDPLLLSSDPDVLANPGAHFTSGQAVQATVLRADDDHKIALSFLGEASAPEVSQILMGQVSSVHDGEAHVKLAAGRVGVITRFDSLEQGQFVRCQVEGLKRNIYTLSLVLAHRSGQLPRRKRKRQNSTDALPQTTQKESTCEKPQTASNTETPQKASKTKKKAEKEDRQDNGVDVAQISTDSNKAAKAARSKISSDSAPCLTVKGFSWDGSLDTALNDSSKADDSDDDGEDITVPETVKSKKKRKRDEEKQIQEVEKSRLLGDARPESSTDYERLVLQSPNSSLVWLAFMAHHVGLGELEKARSVAERALTTISFREEQEKQNVWLAYLNLETSFGEIVDVKKLLERAVLYNDPLNIYLKQANIYVNAGKTEEAEQVFVMLMRKYKGDKSVWKSYMEFLYKAERTQAARNLLQRGLKVMDKKDHVEVINKCATLEFSLGETERGRTMFENLLASCPGRTDLWSVYVDMVVKAGDIPGARQLLERAVKQKLNTKKLSFLVNKYIKFEESHGTEQQVSNVKDMAVHLFDS